MQRLGRSSNATPALGRGASVGWLTAAVTATSLAGVLGASLHTPSLAATPPTKLGAIRIGYQKAGPVLISLKAKGALEKLIESRGGSVQWSEFTAGLPMVEALNAGAIDLAYVGEAPPIFAQAAAGSITRYVAYDPFGPKAEGILVHKDSAIRKLADLKGKKIAVQKGSNTHYLTIKALASVGLKPSDVEIVFLKPSDARAAFERKDVDVWVVWDPFLAAAEANAGARLLANAKGLAGNIGYYLSSSNYIKANTPTLKVVLEQIKQEAAAASANPQATANFLAPVLGLSPSVLLTAEKRRVHGVLPITAKIIEGQQDVADTFSALKLIPKPIKVKDAIWTWK